jgi:hypothetical protein
MEELRQKGQNWSRKTTCHKRGKKYHFQKEGGINNVFGPKYRPLYVQDGKGRKWETLEGGKGGKGRKWETLECVQDGKAQFVSTTLKYSSPTGGSTGTKLPTNIR